LRQFLSPESLMPSHIRSFRNVLNRFRRNRRGATVVEFALMRRCSSLLF
jgi:hypothetical protein